MLSDQSNSAGPKATWSYPKSGDWWSSIVRDMTDKQFKDNFRVQRSTVQQILDQVGPHLQRQDTTFRPAIPIDKRIACALYSLESTSETRAIAHLFGISGSTAANLLHEFTEVLVELFFRCLIKSPTNDQEVKKVTDGFLENWLSKVPRIH